MDKDIIELIPREFSADKDILELINKVENRRKIVQKQKKKAIGRKKCKEVEEEYKLKCRKLILKTLENELEELDNEMKIDDKIIHETQLQRKKLEEEIVKIDKFKYIIMNITIKRVI